MTATAIAVSLGRTTKRHYARVIAVTLLAGIVALIVRNVVVAAHQRQSHAVPQNAAMESVLGVRFSRVAVIEDGGLVQLSYVVLDPEKAQRFQAQQLSPPVIKSRGISLTRVALMKQGHDLRPGQTYYLVYQNTKGAVRSGDHVQLDEAELQLTDVPVW
ncbi:MAG: hypothetical protein JWM93_2788 [Frankiales bacterium]|nr:hypothetical protein [Frankiales bacterium]